MSVKEPPSLLKSQLDTLYYWSKATFGQPICFYHYDKKMLTDFDWVVGRVETQCPDLKISRTDIEGYDENNLLPECNMEDGTRGYPVYTVDRVEFVTKLSKRWGYSPQQLKSFTDFEEAIIDEVCTCSKLDYSELPPLEFLIEWLKLQIRIETYQLKYMKKFSEKERQRKEIKNLKNALKFYKRKKFDRFSDQNQDVICKTVFGINYWYEYSRHMTVFQDRAAALLGFSPDVTFSRVGHGSEDMQAQYEKDFPYVYNEGGQVYYFGEWDDSRSPYISEDVPFFATPEFLVEYGKDNNVNIVIRDTERVTARHMQRVAKIYTSFRKKLSPTKAGWGEKSGRKELIKRRDELLRSTYIKLREEKPRAAADRILEKAIQGAVSDGKLSIERAKKIIYSRKNNMS